ncbi:MAG TPA: nucleotidyltransferase domain-containing protein [Kiritimatiellia bacterium]|jgi:predicted nucleotidyltransferase|nr:MAG: Nucleotidyltransferase domain protein [Verrucomicrobia bacterium ADurb.Bin018]HOE01258.1 nucleotidyltransferase domain-containing protein [Kiritimatiellia bacterium]HOE36610.1 nucleotidyltransferase domain-containing protein [Kiritimatiellia bacterium]HOR74050.1 nucleotidyltransferase domain-containing protein [Kiritimatiellia bacterium]HOU58878.1 nucleotidyltransferase domain-containing protein [Kiritimatiellia bacterium]
MKVLNENIPPALRHPSTGLAHCLRALGQARPVQRVVLFGPYARGEQRPDSDVDLCIVAEGAEDQLAAARDFRRALRNVRPKPAFTLIPITPARFEEKKAAGDYFFKTIQEEGICVAEKVALGERRRPALSPRRKERQGVAP